MREVELAIVGRERRQHPIVEDEIKAEGKGQRDQNRRGHDAIDHGRLQSVAENE